MPLRNGLPIPSGAPWSNTIRGIEAELITTWALDELDAKAAPPNPDIAWADTGTHVYVGQGNVKVPNALPSTLDFVRYKPGTTRDLATFDAVVTEIQAAPFDRSFGFPMVWNTMGNGWELKNERTVNGQKMLVDFMGISGIGKWYVKAGKSWKAQLLGTLLQQSMYVTGSNLGLTSPTMLAYGGDSQGLSANGIALFTDGTGADGTIGAKHYSNPRVQGSGRFSNVFSAYGEFSANYGRSLVPMTQIPDAVLSNTYSGAYVTDTIFPSYMRTKAWNMLVQSLVLQTEQVAGNGVAGAVTNPYALAAALGLTEENFVGQVIRTTFGPKRFHIASQLDLHPYVTANPNTNGTGIPADFWVNVSASPGRPTWAKFICNNEDFIPVFMFFGAGDPRAMEERYCRFIGDLDAGIAGGDPGEVQVFFQV